MPSTRPLALLVRIVYLLATACAGGAAAPDGGAPGAPPAAAFTPGAGQCGFGCTVVIAISPGVATPVVAGPFVVTSINPGGDLELAISADTRCADVGTGWFEYSGGGAKVGSNQMLCARSKAAAVRNHGFSGHRPEWQR